ncbi:MAG: Rrf2 family transcriptional regulator [Acidimicrobiia bacterium]|nr:Rrf2 family transcriptional regulator [Acidimicrobiia bacterium]
MRLGEPVEWALHCTTILALLPDDAALPASKLAEFHGVPAAYLAKALQSLSRAGIVESVPGRHGGYRLGVPAAEVTLLDVVEAVEGHETSFRCTEIRKRGPAKVSPRLYSPVCAIAEAMYRADEAWRAELRKTTIADLLGRLATTVPIEAAVKGAAYLQEVLS